MTKHRRSRKRGALRSQLIAYLGETMPETQRDDFERRLLDEDAFSEEIYQAQQELLEDYADDALSSVHRKQLNSWVFSSSNRRRNVQLTADLLYRGRRAKRIAMWLYAGVFAAIVLLFVGLRLMHPTRYFRRATEVPAEHANLPMPDFAAPPSGAVSFDDPPRIGSSGASSAIRPMIVRLVSERMHGDMQSSLPSVFTIRADAPILLQILVSSGSGCAYSVAIHAETAAVPDRHREHVACVTVEGAQFVDVDLPPGTLPPGAYLVRLSGPEGDLAVRFIVHF